jgi:rhodanese-related sulfurtransferase
MFHSCPATIKIVANIRGWVYRIWTNANPKDKTMKLKTAAAIVLAGLLGGVCVARAADAKDANKPGPEHKAAKAFKNVDVAGFEKLRADRKNVVLDVRTKKEFEAGHVPGAINLDWYAPDFGEQAARLDKSRTYLVHCAGGVRSAKACDKMSHLDFPKLYNLEGGFKAWEKAGNKAEK